MNARQRHVFFKRMQEHNPHPTTELKYTTSFELLIAVMLSAQATDKSVNKVTAQLFQVANTAPTLLALGEEKLRTLIKHIGLFNVKARHIIKTCELLIAHHHGQVPNTREALEALPGVGRKTANVILNTVFGEPTIAVDTHLFRVANRTGLAPGKTVKEVEEKLLATIPKQYLYHAHHWLILHGRYICLAKNPRCKECHSSDLCEYAQDTVVLDKS